GIAPDARAVLGDGEVERGVWQGHVLGAGTDERELQPVLALHPPRGDELLLGDVHADRTRPSPREPRRHVRRPAAELDDVLALDVSEQPELALGRAENPPAELRPRPAAF